MTHKVELVKDLMYKGCELHWHCVRCDEYIPVHCYSKEELEKMECKKKMTNEEALNIIEDVTWQDNGRHYGKIAPAREIAISALEKQIPKKPIKTRSEIVCPTCKTLVGSSPYCRYCGQAIDWDDTE